MQRKRIVVVGGGVRSGKSSFAVELGRRLGERRVFVATATASDDEMRARIDRHRRDREGAFATVEAPVHLADALASLEGCDVVVVDCLTMWLSNLLLQQRSTDEILEDVDRVVGVLS